jgi:hypothetical protein
MIVAKYFGLPFRMLNGRTTSVDACYAQGKGYLLSKNCELEHGWLTMNMKNKLDDGRGNTHKRYTRSLVIILSISSWRVGLVSCCTKRPAACHRGSHNGLIKTQARKACAYIEYASILPCTAPMLLRTNMRCLLGYCVAQLRK